jgi:Flp pilus assembly protein TadD
MTARFRHRFSLLPLLLGLGACASSGMSRQDEAAFAARKQLTREMVARGEWQTAFAYAAELHRQKPDDAEVLTLRGIVYRERRLTADAEADLRAALAANERSAEAHAALGILLDASRRGAEAEVHHKRAVALDANNPGYQNNLGFSLLIRSRYREALSVLRRAASLAPTNPRVRTNLGFAYAAQGDFPRAAREFEMGAGPAEAKNNLGFAYEKKGDLHNAFEQYAAALREDPACARARGNLVQLAQRLGKELPTDLQPAAPAPAPRADHLSDDKEEQP